MRIHDVLRYLLLGPLAVERDGVPLELGPPKQRAVLAVLAQEAGSTVSADRLVGSVWGDNHPVSVVSSLHANVSRLRRLLRADASSPPPIFRRGNGYALDVVAGDVDVAGFRADADALRSGIEAKDWRAAVAAGERAMGRWRGAYLADFGDEEWVQTTAAALHERRSGVLQNLVVGLLGVGDLASALARSTAMMSEQPLVERAAWLHMMALYRAGRTADALSVYRTFAARLADDLGLDAGPALRDLHGGILRQQPDLWWWPGPSTTASSTTASSATASSATASSAAASVVPGVVEPQDGRSDSTARGNPPAATAGSAPLGADRMVGRRAELDVVAATLAQARTDGARWLIVTGPAGIGKTRLSQQAEILWRAAGGSVVRGQCPDADTLPPWWPIRQVLGELGADADTVLAPPSDGDVDAVQFAVLERAAQVVRHRLAAGPLMIVIDDVHWADRATLRLLTLLVETIGQRGFVVVLTARDASPRSDFDRLRQGVARRAGSRQVRLTPLGRDEVAELVAQISGEPVTGAEAAQLAEHTGGTPFFVVEWARLPAEQRRSEMVPTAVQTVLRRRFSGLRGEVLDLLRVAAVLGDDIDADLLARMLDRAGEDTADLLDEAADDDLLLPSVTGASYTFAHALVRAELAAGVPALRRRRLHRQAAGALASTGAGDMLRRAGHLKAAGPLADPAECVAAFRASAQLAEQQWQSDTAATWWSAAVEALDRQAEVDPEQRDDLVRAQVRALALAGRGQAMLEVLDAAVVDALRAGRTGSVGRLAANLLRVSGSWPWPVYGSDPAPLLATLRGLDPFLRNDPGARSRVLAVTAIGHCYDPNPDVPDRMSRLAVNLAEQTGDPDVLADALLGRALTYAGVATHAAESVEILDRLAQLEHADAAVDAVLGHNLLTMATMHLGQVGAAAEHTAAGALGSDVLRLPINRVQLRWAEAGVAQWRGELRRAEQLYQQAEAAHRRTDLQQAGTFELAEVILRWDQGRLDEVTGVVPTNPAVSVWTTAVADAAADRPGADAALAREVGRAEPEVWTSAGRLTLLAHAVADRGLAELAPPLLAQLAPLLPYLATVGQIGTVGPVPLAAARLHDLLGDRAEARAQLERATGMARDAGGASALLHCRLLAATWAVADAVADSAVELAAIAAEAEERGMTGIARHAAELAATTPSDSWR